MHACCTDTEPSANKKELDLFIPVDGTVKHRKVIGSLIELIHRVGVANEIKKLSPGTGKKKKCHSSLLIYFIMTLPEGF